MRPVTDRRAADRCLPGVSVFLGSRARRTVPRRRSPRSSPRVRALPRRGHGLTIILDALLLRGFTDGADHRDPPVGAVALVPLGQGDMKSSTPGPATGPVRTYAISTNRQHASEAHAAGTLYGLMVNPPTN